MTLRPGARGGAVARGGGEAGGVWDGGLHSTDCQCLLPAQFWVPADRLSGRNVTSVSKCKTLTDDLTDYGIV